MPLTQDIPAQNPPDTFNGLVHMGHTRIHPSCHMRVLKYIVHRQKLVLSLYRPLDAELESKAVFGPCLGSTEASRATEALWCFFLEHRAGQFCEKLLFVTENFLRIS